MPPEKNQSRAEGDQLGLWFEENRSPGPATGAADRGKSGNDRQAPAQQERVAKRSTLPAWAAAAVQRATAQEATPPAQSERPSERVWRVGDLVGEVRNHIEGEYADLRVRGEVSNLRSAPSGHVYFTLKDGEAQLPAVLFRRQAQLLRFSLSDGLEVVLRGRVSVYEQRGQMQLIAETLEPAGTGSLQLALEQLKRRLDEEGLFALDRKRPLPAFPHCVGIVTSPAGAVIRDFLHVAARRHAALDVLLYPATVQGDTAAGEIAAGIAYFNAVRNVDVIVIARGGGSLEDMAAFNSEGVARAIAASTLPVVSAVGHETDFTLADFVADLRAPTPSAAAELITAAQHRIGDQVAALHDRLGRAMRYRLSLAENRAARVGMDAAFARVRGSLGRRQQRTDELRFRLERAAAGIVRAQGEKLNGLTTRLHRQDAAFRLQLMRERWVGLQARLLRGASARLGAARHQLTAAERALATLSPTAVLGRGYALVFGEDGRLLRDAGEAQPGQAVTARLARGLLQATITGRTTEDR